VATVWVIMFVWVVASALVAMGFVYGVAVGRRHGTTNDRPITADEHESHQGVDPHELESARAAGRGGMTAM
jgi:hypothetical protein